MKRVKHTKRASKSEVRLDNSRRELAHRFWIKVTFYSLIFSTTILAILTLHGSLFPEQETLTLLTRAILIQPFNPEPHRKLGEFLLRQGAIAQAQQELTLAKDLGDSQAQQAYELQQRSLKQLQQQVEVWEKQVQTRPDYRDAYLQLALLYYQLGERAQARENIAKARQLDPVYPAVKQLTDLVDQ